MNVIVVACGGLITAARRKGVVAGSLLIGATAQSLLDFLMNVIVVACGGLSTADVVNMSRLALYLCVTANCSNNLMMIGAVT